MFFSTKPKKTAARLLQQHEYLDLLEGGLEKQQPSDAETASALALAREVWSPLHLGTWDESASNTFAWRNQERGQVLVHVPTGLQDCFLIVAFGGGTATPDAYILFDVGAEYVHASIACPAFGLVGPTSVEDISRVIPQLPEKTEPFTVVELRGGTYMQVYADEQGFHLEHQLVTPGAHYRCVDVVSPEVAVDTLVSYAFGKYEWAYDRRWERIVL
jgi:hypothetical protein